MQLLVVGRLGKPRGLRGDVYLEAWNPSSPHWTPGTRLYLLSPPVELAPARSVVEAEPSATLSIAALHLGAKGRMALELDGVGDRSAAEALRGCYVALPVDALDPPAADAEEFFHYEMPGWRVVTVGGRLVGEVVATGQTSVDVLEIRPASGGATFFIPMIGDVVRELNRSRREIVIEAIEGLLP